MKDKLADWARQNPEGSNADAAAYFCVSAQRISQVTKALGLQLNRKPRSERKSRFVDAYLARLPGNSVGKASNTRNSGAIAEMLVAADLLAREFVVFVPLTPFPKFDLAAYHSRSHNIFRVEVKTGVQRPDPTRNGHYDILATVSHAGEIRYEPNLESLIRR